MDENYTNMAVHVQEIDSRCRSNEHRLDDHEKEIHKLQEKQDTIYDLASSVKSIAIDMTYMKEDMKEVKADIVYLKAEVVSLRSDVDTLKIEVAALREDVDILKVEVVSLRNDVDTLKQDMKEVKADIIYLKTNQKESRRYSDIILDEIERVHGILDKHQKDKSVHTA